MPIVGKDDAGERHLVERADGLADHCECVMANLAGWHDIVGRHQIEVVDLASRHEFVDLNGAGGFQRDVLKFVLGDFEYCPFKFRIMCSQPSTTRWGRKRYPSTIPVLQVYAVAGPTFSLRVHGVV